jgi:acetyl/propionyl-CoA carboxylase alpha subunit
VAVYSESDAHSLFVKQADEAVFIGNSEAAQSYLNVDKLIAAAKSVKADAIHPGI